MADLFSEINALIAVEVDPAVDCVGCLMVASEAIGWL